MLKCHPYTRASVHHNSDGYIREIVYRARGMQNNLYRRREAHRILKDAENTMEFLRQTWSSTTFRSRAVLSYLVQEGLEQNVSYAVRDEPSLARWTAPCFLDMALRPTKALLRERWPSPPIIFTFLKHRATPNQVQNNSTVWALFLQRLARRDFFGRHETVFPAGNPTDSDGNARFESKAQTPQLRQEISTASNKDAMITSYGLKTGDELNVQHGRKQKRKEMSDQNKICHDALEKFDKEFRNYHGESSSSGQVDLKFQEAGNYKIDQVHSEVMKDFWIQFHHGEYVMGEMGSPTTRPYPISVLR